MIVQLTDIDECELGSAMCHQNASCENTVGGYLCSCAVGLTGNGFNCSGKHLGIIGNNIAEVYLVYVTTLLHATDVDECTMVNDCAQGCNNTIGSFECYCQLGYELEEDEKSCKG